MFQRLGYIFDEYKGIPREANLLIYSSFFTWAAAGLLFISLQVFLVLEGISFATSSLILGTFGIVSASSTLLFGGLADRYGKKKFIVMGGVLGSLALAIFAIDSNISKENSTSRPRARASSRSDRPATANILTS